MTEGALVDRQIRAQGMLVAFLASLLERSEVIAAAEFGVLLELFAQAVSKTDPEEGEILVAWAAAVRTVAVAADLH